MYVYLNTIFTAFYASETRGIYSTGIKAADRFVLVLVESPHEIRLVSVVKIL